MYRFLATRRWLIRTVAGLLLVTVCIRLGLWQLDRNDQRSERNEVIETNADAPTVPVSDLLAPTVPFDDTNQWRRVEVEGRYDIEHQLMLHLRPLDGQRGVHVITPLVTSSGTALLVDRGFYPSSDNVPDVPPAPAGDVSVVARLRVTEDHRGLGGSVDDGLIRSVNVDELAGIIPYPLYPAWAEAIDPVDDRLVELPPPEAEVGPHLSYAFQWFIFATVGLVGYVFLVRAEARGRDQTDRADRGLTRPEPPRSPPPPARAHRPG